VFQSETVNRSFWQIGIRPQRRVAAMRLNAGLTVFEVDDNLVLIYYLLLY